MRTRSGSKRKRSWDCNGEQKTKNIGDSADGWRIFRIMAEFVEGFETMSKVGKAVSIFGSCADQAG